MLPALFVAEFTPLSPAAQLAIVSMLVVVVAVTQIATSIYNARRKPPLDSELTTLRLSIQSLEKTVGSLAAQQARHAGHESEISNLREQVRRLEACRIDDAATHRRHVGHIGDNITTQIEAMKNTIAANFKSVERALGQVEGELKGVNARIESLENR